jgi:hypothetical protein
VFAALVAGVHLAVYLKTAGSPFSSSPPVWHGWWDQSQYLRSARAFAEGDLAAAEHWYALGYPLLAAPMLRFLPRDPFVVVNAISLVIFAVAFVAFFGPEIGVFPSMAVFMIAQLVPASMHVPHRVEHPVWLQYVVPWNTIPVAALLMLIVYLVSRLDPKDSLLKDAALGFLPAMVVAIRPSDAAPLLVAGAFYFRNRVLREHAVAKVGAAVAAAASALALYALLSWAIYGGLWTPYHTEVRAIGASISDLHERAYAILIDARVTHGQPALATLQPWLIVALPFAGAWAVVNRKTGLLMVGAAVVSVASYLTFHDFWPYALLRLSLFHYVAWTLPVFAAAGVAGAMAAIRKGRWGVLAATLACAALLVSLRLVATPVAPTRVSIEALPNAHTRYEMSFPGGEEIDAIDFVGAATADAWGVTLKSFHVLVDGGPLDIYSGYRPIQLASGLRLGLTKHVAPRNVVVILDNTISAHPADPSRVRALRFQPVFALR